MNKQQKIDDLKNRNFHWEIPWDAVSLIAYYEDCRLTAYRCPAGVPTIGWGETDGVQMGSTWTKEQADTRFNEEVNRFATRVRSLITEYATPEQLGAMTALAYNIGLGAFEKSTVRRAHNAGNYEAAARAFSLWNKATVGGKKVQLRGLVARRAAEAALYLLENEPVYAVPNVQAVDAESTLSKSPISIAGASSVVVGGGAVATEVIGDAIPILTKFEQATAAFNINPLVALGIVAVVIGYVVWTWRKTQREEGWA